MRWCYYLTEADKNEDGNWVPRIVFADGMVTRSSFKVRAESIDQARHEVGQRNWWAGHSQEDTEGIINQAVQHNALLTEEGYWGGWLLKP